MEAKRFQWDSKRVGGVKSRVVIKVQVSGGHGSPGKSGGVARGQGSTREVN